MTAIEALLMQPAAQAIGWALVQFIWQGALIGAVTACALAALRRSAADVRYVVATIGLSVMLTVPAVTAVQAWRGARTAAAADAVSGAWESGTVPSTLATEVREPAAAGSTDATKVGFSGGTIRRSDSRERLWMRAVLVAWLAGVALLTLRLLSGWLWICRTRAHGTSPVPSALCTAAARLQRQLHIRRSVQYLESAIVQVPTVIGCLRPVVLLPASALTALTPQQIEAILAHELAHIRRHDYLVNLLQTLVETLLFYHPAVWWLSRRIRAEREHCCDDLAVSLCGDPLMYASALADLEELRGDRGLALAASGGPLLRRVRRIIGAPTHAGRAPGWLAASVAIVLLGGITAGALGAARAASEPQPPPPATAAPAAAIATVHTAPPPSPARQEHVTVAPAEQVTSVAQALEARAVELQSRAAEITAATENVRAAIEPVEARALSIDQSATAVTSVVGALETRAAALIESVTAVASTMPRVAVAQSKQSGNFSWSDGTRRLEVKYNGAFEFTDDDRDVRSLSPGGYLHIREKGPAGEHRLELTTDASGALQRRFYVGRSERPFEPEGRIWLAEALPRFIRQTGLGAPARVARFLRSGGVDAVLAEIARIEGSWGRRLYYTELLQAEGVDARALETILARAGRDIESDFELASLLIAVADRSLQHEGARRGWFEAASTIGSDFEARRLLSSVLGQQPVSPEVLAGVLEAAARIGSDFEAAQLLMQGARLQPFDDRTRALFFKAAAGIGSAFERRRVLSAIVSAETMDQATLVSVLESAGEIGSDFERAALLTAIAQRHSLENAARTPFFRAAEGIDSAFERGRVLKSVVAREDASAETVLGALRAVQSMPSDFEATQVLLAIAARHPVRGEARDLYIATAERLGDHQQGQALSALVRNERIGR